MSTSDDVARMLNRLIVGYESRDEQKYRECAWPERSYHNVAEVVALLGTKSQIKSMRAAFGGFMPAQIRQLVAELESRGHLVTIHIIPEEHELGAVWGSLEIFRIGYAGDEVTSWCHLL